MKPRRFHSVDAEAARLGLEKREGLPRIALTVGEAAGMLGMSETAFRDHLYAACPKFHAGRGVRIPLRPFEDYVLALADAEPLLAEALLRDVESSE